jgi:hypothetical protein
MTDAEQLAYFMQVLTRLDALRLRAPKDTGVSKLAAEASKPIGDLVSYFLSSTTGLAPE